MLGGIRLVCYCSMWYEIYVFLVLFLGLKCLVSLMLFFFSRLNVILFGGCCLIVLGWGVLSWCEFFLVIWWVCLIMLFVFVIVL